MSISRDLSLRRDRLLLASVLPAFALRKRRWLLCFLTAAIAVTSVVLFTREEPWHTLPDGTKVRLKKIAFAKKVAFRIGGLELRPLRGVLGKWSFILGPEPSSAAFIGSEESLHIVFQTEGSKGWSNLDGAICKIALPDGGFVKWELLSGASYSGSGYLHAGGFAYPRPPNVPENLRRLEIDLTVQGKTIHFSKPNPAFGRSDK